MNGVAWRTRSTEISKIEPMYVLDAGRVEFIVVAGITSQQNDTRKKPLAQKDQRKLKICTSL
jgi:hypothetical protein